MATNPKSTANQPDLQEEFDALKKQVNELVKALKVKGEEKTENLGKKLESEMEHYHEKAEEKLQNIYETGDAELKKLSKHIRKNPVSSLLVAFSAGYLISKLLDHDK